MATQLNLELGRKRRDDGMKQALDHANAVNNQWQVQALTFFFRYCLEHRNESFMTEDVRWWAEESGLPEPPDKRAWGAIANIAKRRGLIRSIGYAPQKATNAHCAPKTVWVAL